MYPLLTEVKSYVAARLDERGRIDELRRRQLLALSQYVEARLREGRTAELTFICTHNSRRSHMAQIWAQTSAEFFKLPGVRTYSGGTEVAAFHPSAVRAIAQAGFLVDEKGEGKNPVYLVRSGRNAEPMKCFSKLYNDPSNPAGDFCAVMTCAQAEEACPVVFGATQRISLPYEDPKRFDGTDLQEQKYAERCADIAREMLYAFSHVTVGPTKG
jgi:arsenate reductase